MNRLQLRSRIEDQLEEHIEILEAMIRDPMLRASQRIAAIKQLQAILLLLEKRDAQRGNAEFTDEEDLPISFVIN